MLEEAFDWSDPRVRIIAEGKASLQDWTRTPWWIHWGLRRRRWRRVSWRWVQGVESRYWEYSDDFFWLKD